MRDFAPLLLILAIGVGLRAAYLFEAHAQPEFAHPLADEAFHDYWARAILTGDWTPPAGQLDPKIPQSPYLRPPGYPYFLAAVYTLCGKSYLAARIVQLTIGLLSCILGYRLGRALFGRTAGLLVALLLSAYWGFLYYELQLQETFLVVFLLLLALELARHWLKQTAWHWAALLGITLGAGALVRPNLLGVIPVVLLWMAWILWKRRPARAARNATSQNPSQPRPSPHWSSLLATIAAIVLCIAPVTIRNYRVSGDFVLVSANGALNLWIGNNPFADGYTPRFPELSTILQRPSWSWFGYHTFVNRLADAKDFEPTLANTADYFKNQALEYMAENPARTAGLFLKRAVMFWGPTEIANNKVVHYDRVNSLVLRFLPTFPILLAFAILGAIMLRWPTEAQNTNPPETPQLDPPNRRNLLLATTLILFTYYATYIPFLVAERFRIAAAALLTLFAAYALARLWYHAALRQWRRFTPAACGAVVLLVLTHIPLYPYDSDSPAFWYMQKTLAYKRQNDDANALRNARHALELDPTYAEAAFIIADIRAEQGNLDQAIPLYRKYIDMIVEKEGPQAKLARLLNERGVELAAQRHFQKAAEHFRETLNITPDNPEALCNLANVLVELGRIDDAVTAYQQAIDLSPDHRKANMNLAIALARKGDMPAAADAFQNVIRIDPDNFRAYHNRGIILAQLGRRDEALQSFRQALRIRPNDPASLQYINALSNPNNQTSDNQPD